MDMESAPSSPTNKTAFSEHTFPQEFDVVDEKPEHDDKLHSPPSAAPSRSEKSEQGHTDADFRLQFSLALQELRDIRPHLYSAAEYCESAYMHSEQKSGVLDNLKNYSIKALVNAVDHIGTVAFRLNESLYRQASEVSSLEMRTASVTQRLQSCYERRNSEGLKQYQYPRTEARRHCCYILRDAGNSEVSNVLHTNKIVEPVVGKAKSDPSLGKSLSWHLSVEASPTSSKSIPVTSMSEEAIRYASPLSAFWVCFVLFFLENEIGIYFRSLHLGDQQQNQGTITWLTSTRGPVSSTRGAHDRISSSLGSSRSLLSLMSLDESTTGHQTSSAARTAALAQKKHTRMLTSLLSRNRNANRKQNEGSLKSNI